MIREKKYVGSWGEKKYVGSWGSCPMFEDLDDHILIFNIFGSHSNLQDGGIIIYLTIIKLSKDRRCWTKFIKNCR